jgi:acetyl esterase/lipase
MKKAMFFGLLCTICVFSFSQSRELNFEDMAIESSKYWLDIDYVGDRIVGHRLDVHLPENGEAPFPVVVAVYGSAWFSNSSKGAAFHVGLGQKLLQSGFAVVSINHRSSDDAKFPAQIQDVKAAIRFIRANSEKLSLDSSFIAITGWSSGGHLAALAGTTNSTKTHNLNDLEVDIEGDLGSFTQTGSHVDAVVDWFGPTDFLIMDSCGSSFSHDDVRSPESSLIGGAIQDNPGKCALANPITYVHKGNPPFLIFHGDKDPLVPHCQSRKLFENLQKEGVESELVVVSEGGHGPGVMIEKYYDQMIAFLKNQLKTAHK